MGLGNFFEELKWKIEDTIENREFYFDLFRDSVGEVANGFDEMVGDVKVITSDFIREEKEIIKEAIVDRAYIANYTLGEATEIAFGVGDKISEGIKNLSTTAKNPLADGDRVEISDLRIGDHIFIHCGFTHHGIFVGDDEVVHYTRNGDFRSVDITSIEEFSGGGDLYRKSYNQSPTRYSGEEVASRAKERLCEEEYDLFFNNCEHFARWCRIEK
ncbi:MAG: lecithin retinol acyltransferase family protein [Defluviitaleaceae bacterium]|nr:lecithin retinol acyltransferase family protein [Defluviitaleaceae bacterium]